MRTSEASREAAEVDLSTALTWLKRVSGIDDEYLWRWGREAWVAWATAMRAAPDSANPSVPTWMQPHLGKWHRDFSIPFPCVAQLWPTGHDWFLEAQTHADFSMMAQGVAEGAAPSIADVSGAWSLAADSGVIPLVSMSVVPSVPVGGGVVGEVEALYVIAAEIPGPLRLRLEALMGGKASSVPVMGRNADDLLREAGLEGIDQADVLAWEWMYG